MIREASFKDRESVEALKRRYGLGIRDRDEWRYIWENNPAAGNGQNTAPIGWVLESEDRRIVGYLGNIPLAYEFEGRRIRAAAGTSLVVDADYKNYAILLVKSFFAQGNADLLLLTSANCETGKIFSAFKAQKVPVESYDKVLFWVINHREFVSSVFLKRKLPFKGALIHPLSLTMRGIDKLAETCRRMPRIGQEIRQCAVFDERFDAFWSVLKKSYGYRLLYVRDKEHLDWHFKSAINGKKIWIFVSEKDSRIDGYAIFLRQDPSGSRLKRMRLVDFQCVGTGADMIMQMISHAVKKCRMEDIHVLEILGFGPRKRSAMEKYFHYKRTLPNWPFFYKTNDLSLSNRLSNPDRWDPCLLDGDSAF